MDSLLAAGVTTVIGLWILADREDIEGTAATGEMPDELGIRCSAVFGPLACSGGSCRARCVCCGSRGMLAVVGKSRRRGRLATLDRLDLPLLEIESIAEVDADGAGLSRTCATNSDVHIMLVSFGQPRGRIGRGSFADLQILRLPSLRTLPSPFRIGERLKRVVVAGETVWENGKHVGGSRVC